MDALNQQKDRYFSYSLNSVIKMLYSQKVVVSPAHNGAKSNMMRSGQITPYFCSTNHYQQQLNMESIRQHSLSDAIRMASQANMKHDANGCCCCDAVAGCYMTALRYASESEPILCNNDLYELVWRMTNLVLAHRETTKYQYLSWFDLITRELWAIAKRLKEESYECDLHIPISASNSKRSSIDENATDDDSDSTIDGGTEEEYYRRAIRMTIYNCRALVYEQAGEVTQAIVYYRKCAAVRPSPYEHQQLQQVALAAMQRLIESNPTTLTLKRPAYSLAFMSCQSISTSTTASSSSSTSSTKSSLCCSNCGVEKAAMPVCAKCKTQPYCSVRCMKSHKDVHSSVCHSS